MDVADDADDGAVSAHRDHAADRIFAGEVVLRCRLVDDDDAGRSLAIVFAEEAAASERNLQGAVVLRCHVSNTDAAIGIQVDVLARNPKSRPAVIAGQRYTGRNHRCVRDAWNAPDAFQKVGERG